MVKQVIVVNKSLKMSEGKMSTMVAHGATAFFTNWMKRHKDYFDSSNHKVNISGSIDSDIYYEWIVGGFTKITLEAEDEFEMREIICKATEKGMRVDYDFFNIVDESTEFSGIPCWAVIAFAPMEAERINEITGHLNLYGYENSSLSSVGENQHVIFEKGERKIVDSDLSNMTH